MGWTVLSAGSHCARYWDSTGGLFNAGGELELSKYVNSSKPPQRIPCPGDHHHHRGSDQPPSIPVDGCIAIFSTSLLPKSERTVLNLCAWQQRSTWRRGRHSTLSAPLPRLALIATPFANYFFHYVFNPDRAPEYLVIE